MATGLPKEMLPSFLDRLVDAGQADASGAVVYTLEKMIDAVRADIEDLLNTRQSRSMVDCPFPLVKESILAYGLPDLNALAGAKSRNPEAIGRYIAKLVEKFEPRLNSVRVAVESDDVPSDQVTQIHFQISGRLNVDPAPEVGFETIFELATGHSKVQSAANLT